MRKTVLAALCVNLIVLCSILVGPVRAQEVFVSGGVTRDASSGTSATQWSVGYVEGLGEHLQLSLTYLNEGHQPNHYRDGLTPQIWGRVNTLDRRLSLALGVGPYFYFDTKVATVGDAYSDAHGVGLIASAAATWYGMSPFLLRLGLNYISTPNSFDTLSAVLGVGYQFDAPSSPGPKTGPGHQANMATNNEITVFAGRTVLNSAKSEYSGAYGIEYRRGLFRHIDWTVTALNEGDSRPIGRYGLMSQLWAVRAFSDDRIAVGFGLGPYWARDKYSGTDGERTTLAGAVSLSATYRITTHWAFRLTFNRIFTDYDRDTDVFLSGVTYRF